MFRKVISRSVAFLFVAIIVPTAAANNDTVRRRPLLVEAETGTPVVIIDRDNPLSAVFDLHLLVENVSKKKTISVTDITGELEFSDGSTTPFEFPSGFVLEPGEGTVFFAAIIVPFTAPRGDAVARVAVGYQVDGHEQHQAAEVKFKIVHQ